MHEQVDHGIGPSSAGIALLDHAGAAARDVQPGHDIDRPLIGPLQGDEPFGGRPPVAGVAVHLLLGDELRRGPGDQALTVGRDGPFAAGTDVMQEQVLVAHETDEGAIRRDLGVDLVGLGLRQPLDIPALPAGQEDVAFQRREDIAPLFVPRIFDHAALTDPHPLPPRLLGLRQLAGVGDQGPGVDQLERLTLARRRGPQVLYVDVVLTRAQEGDQGPVRRQADALGHRAVQAGVGEDALRRQHRGVGRLGEG